MISLAGSSRGRAGSTPSVRESRPAQPTKKGEEKMIDAEGSRLLADVFNTLTEGQENIMPEDVAERIERFMTANGFRMVFSRWYLQCEPEVKQEPVAIVDANDEGYWADILPDRSVKVGQPLFAYAPDAQAEIAKLDARIAELEADQDKANAAVAIGNYLGKTYNYAWCNTSLASQTIDLLKEQASEISRLKAVIGKCKEVLEDCHQNINQERRFASEIERDIEQTLDAIKEIGL